MSKKPTYNLNRFRELVIEGKTKSQIITEMKIPENGYSQFSSLEYRLFKKDKKYYEITPEPVKSPVESVVQIGNKENIVISKKVLAGSSFKKDNKFNVSFEDKKITLTLIEDDKNATNTEVIKQKKTRNKKEKKEEVNNNMQEKVVDNDSTLEQTTNEVKEVDNNNETIKGEI